VQNDAIRQFCHTNGLGEPFILEEPLGTSGRKLEFRKRPKGYFILNTLVGGDTLIVTRACRIGRNFGDCWRTVETLHKRGVRIVVLSMGGRPVDFSSAMDRGMFIILAWVADVEAEFISDRTKSDLAYRKAHGMVYNKSPRFKKAVCYDRNGNHKPFEQFSRAAGDCKMLEWDRELIRQVISVMHSRQLGLNWDQCRQMCEAHKWLSGEGVQWWKPMSSRHNRNRNLNRFVDGLAALARAGDVLPPDVQGAVMAFLPTPPKKRSKMKSTRWTQTQKMPTPQQQQTWTAEEWRAFFAANEETLKQLVM
jgi:DNA invertase Pin-like site-specific DNA recombinase